MLVFAALGASPVVVTGAAVVCSAEALAAVVADVGAAALGVGATLVGVVACALCVSGEVVEGIDDADDSVGDADVGMVDTGELVTVVDESDEGAVPDVGVSEVAEVVSGGAPGVLVGSTAGTSAADDGGTV